MISDVGVDEFADAKLDPVSSVPEEDFAKHGEVGPAVAVCLEAEPVIDLRGRLTLKEG